MENVIMMINNAGDVFKLCISTKRKHMLYNLKYQSGNPCNRYARYISYQWYCKRFKEVFNASLLKICGLACTWTVSIFITLTYMQTRFRHQNKTILYRYQNEIHTVNQLQFNYSTNIHLLILRFMKSITIKLNTLTDVPYQMTVGGAFVYVCENLWKRSR